MCSSHPLRHVASILQFLLMSNDWYCRCLLKTRLIDHKTQLKLPLHYALFRATMRLLDQQLLSIDRLLRHLRLRLLSPIRQLPALNNR